MYRRLLVFALVALLCPAVLGEVIVDDHFDDGDIGANATGIGTGFDTVSLTGGSVTESDSSANLINTNNGAARAGIASNEGASLGAGITRFEFRGVSFLRNTGNTGTGSTGRTAVGVRGDGTAEDVDGGVATGFWIQFESGDIGQNNASWSGTSTLFYESSTGIKTVLATWEFDTLNWDDNNAATMDFTPVLNVTLDLSPSGYSLTIEGDTISNVTGSLSGSYASAGITNELTIGHAFAFNQGEAPGLNMSVDQIVVTEDASGPELASLPNPADDATDVLRNVILSWTPGVFAQTHDVYFGTNFDDVNTAGVGSPLLVSPGQIATTYDPPGNLEFEQTYYWRIDEVNAPAVPGTYRGTVWSFTVEPYTYPVEDVSVTTTRAVKAGSEPEKMIDGSGLLPDGGHSVNPTTMWQSTGALAEEAILDFAFDRIYKLAEIWVWNFNHEFEQFLKFSVKDITVEYAVEPNEWMTLGDFTLTQGVGSAATIAQALDAQDIAARYVRLTVKSNYGGTGVGLAEIQFRYIPTFAREPEPPIGAEGVAPDTMLSWRPGREAVTHQIHIGTDASAVAAGQLLAATSNVPSYSAAALELRLGQTYYWMITEVNNAETPTAWDSDVWELSTPDFLVVDDMESYDDDENRIYLSWVDGLDDLSNGGSQVGTDDPPYAERDIVHGGRQAMLFQFGRGGATTSEADLTLDGMKNWTAGGAKTLVVWFRGEVGNGTPQLYAKINSTRIDYTGSTASLGAPMWKQWNIDLTSVAAARNVSSLSLGVSGAGSGTIYFDDIRLYREAPPQTGNAIDPGAQSLVAYYPMNDSLADASGKGRNGTAELGSSFGAGPSGYGRALVLDGVSGYASLPIGPVVQASSSMTVASWIRVTTAGTWARLFDFNNGTTNVYMFFAPSNGSASRFAITTNSNGAESGVNGSPMGADGMWHHVACVIDGTSSEMSLYIDGTLAASGPTALLPRNLGNTTDNYIGQSAWTDPFLTGSVDEFRIYDRALSAPEIQYLLGDR